jgi:hypothetical protein
MPALPLQLPEKKNTIRLETQLKDPKIQIILRRLRTRGASVKLHANRCSAFRATRGVTVATRSRRGKG